MRNTAVDNTEFEDEDFSNFVPEPWVIEAGLMVIENGEPKITQKGLAALREMMEADNSNKKPN